MHRKTLNRIGVLLGVVILVVGGVTILLLALRSRPADSPALTAAPLPEPTPSASAAPVAASVNGVSISYAAWEEAVRIDQVMSGIASQPAPTAADTLQRLINEELLLQLAPPQDALDTGEIERHIAALEGVWGVEDAAVNEALERVGLSRAVFERTVGRLLSVQSALESLAEQGYDQEQWLEEQRAVAAIEVSAGLAAPSISAAPMTTAAPRATAASVVADTPLPATPTLAPSSTPSPSPSVAAEVSTPLTVTSATPLAGVAPDFTLIGAHGIQVTLSEQLARGPVVLVFFQRGRRLKP